MTEQQIFRFWKFVDKAGGINHLTHNNEPCWLWTGGVTSSGYGSFNLGYCRAKLVHVLAYEMLIGPVPAGLELDHLCRNRLCLNPVHLEAVCHSENVRRGASPAAKRAKQTHCLRGHEFIGHNVITRPDGRRQCRTCFNEWQRAKRAATRSVS